MGSVGPIIFPGLLPILSITCLVGIWITLGQSLNDLLDLRHRALRLTCLFFFLAILVVAQLAYWMLRRKRSGTEVLKATGIAAASLGLFLLAGLAAVIFLFVTCYALVN
jgi:hypothetical protein